MNNLAVILLPIKVIVLIFKAISLIVKHTNKTEQQAKPTKPNADETFALETPLSEPVILHQNSDEQTEFDNATEPSIKTEPIRDFEELYMVTSQPSNILKVSKAELDSIIDAFGYDAASTVGFAMRKLGDIQSYMEESQGIVEIQERSGLRRFTSVEDFIAWRNNYWGSYYDL